MSTGGVPLQMFIDLQDGHHDIDCRGTSVELRRDGVPIITVEGDWPQALDSILR